MSVSKNRQPKYRHYKPKNLAVVRIEGRDIYLGIYDSLESWEKYHRTIAEWISSGQEPAPAPSPVPSQAGDPKPELTVAEVLNTYRKHARTYYVKNGQPTKELTDMKYAARPVRNLYGSLAAAKFGPLALKAVRQHMIDEEKLGRGVVNNRVNRIKRIFKWAVSEEVLPPSVYEGLRTVQGLKFGRTSARETDPVQLVSWAWVEPVLKHVAPQVAAMIQLQWLTGMRPCEVVIMRAGDLDMSDSDIPAGEVQRPLERRV